MARSENAMRFFLSHMTGYTSSWICKEGLESLKSFKIDYQNVMKRYRTEIDRNNANYNDANGLKDKLLRDLSIHGRWKEDLSELYEQLIDKVAMPLNKELDDLDTDEEDAFVSSNGIFINRVLAAKKEIRIMIKNITATQTTIRKELDEQNIL